MTDDDRTRLMGWKAIGNFVGRDARTARRWETERGLPVHRVPGGGSASIWADRHELLAWMARDEPVAVPVSAMASQVASAVASSVAPPIALAVAVPAPGTPAARRQPVRALAVGGLVTMAAIALAMFFSPGGGTTQVAVAPYGNDAAANAAYQTASYAMHSRSVAGLFDAEKKFGTLATRHPGNALGFAGIAETNLLLREFNSIPEEVAYRRANFAAQKALALDPRSPSALRSLGFVRYWSDGDRVAGLDLFRRAIAEDSNDSQSYHWYGTALFGEGHYAQALAMLDRARHINPGSSAISADEAMVRYVMGDHDAARSALRQVTDANPTFSGAHSYLARIDLIERDDAGFLAEAAIAARLKRDDDRSRSIEAAASAYARGGHAAMMASLRAAAEQAFQQSGEGAILIATLHAIDGNRAMVLHWLTRAESIREPSIGSLRSAAEFSAYRDDPAFKRFFGGQP